MPPINSSISSICASGAASARIAVITCAVLESEIHGLAKTLPGPPLIHVLPQGLHNTPAELRRQLQSSIEQIENDHHPQVIVLGYGLCSRGTEGVTTRQAKLVMARAHDCITLLLGCRKRYADYVQANPGTYWYSPGWNKYHLAPGKARWDKLKAEYIEKYGADNADFLMETEQTWFTTYNRATYVDLGIAATEQDLEFTRECANWLNWDFDHQHGDPTLLHDLLAGPWDDHRFIVLEPGQSLELSPDERVVRTVGIRRGSSPDSNPAACSPNAPG